MLNWCPVCVFKSVVCVSMCFLIAKLSQISHSGLAYRNCLLPHWFGFPFLLPCLSPLDSVWAVYILPEEVGTRCTIIGMNVLTLRSGVPNRTVGKLSIINPADPSNPLVSWERDKMRRTGKTGNLVFIEIGRRCQGGPGLVWMYAGSEEAQALRETLHKWVILYLLLEWLWCRNVAIGLVLTLSCTMTLYDTRLFASLCHFWKCPLERVGQDWLGHLQGAYSMDVLAIERSWLTLGGPFFHIH